MKRTTWSNTSSRFSRREATNVFSICEPGARAREHLLTSRRQLAG